MTSKTIQKLDLPCYMFDCRECLRPSSFMDIAQELAAAGSADGGFSDQDIAKHGLVWILARMKVVFNKVPHRCDSVTAETWHRGLSGPYFIRDYRLLDTDGGVAVSSTSTWVIMDTASRRAVRGDHITDIIPSSPQCNEEAAGDPADKIIFPKNAAGTIVAEHKVVYSDLDYNGHANNAKYTLWALDVLPPELTTNNTPKEITVNFNNEARLGEVVTLLHCQHANVHIVEGRSNGLQVFIEKIIY